MATVRKELYASKALPAVCCARHTLAPRLLVNKHEIVLNVMTHMTSTYYHLLLMVDWVTKLRHKFLKSTRWGS